MHHTHLLERDALGRGADRKAVPRLRNGNVPHIPREVRARRGWSNPSSVRLTVAIGSHYHFYRSRMKTINRSGAKALAALLAAVCALTMAHSMNAQAERGQTQPVEEGIPVTDATTISRCSSCHAKDDKGNLSRISGIRSTPEGWEEVINRMISADGAKITPIEARAILKYLSDSHGLAPEEAKPVMYMAERRTVAEPVPDKSLGALCMSCHQLGQVLEWRRTRAEWSLLTDGHAAQYPKAGAAFRSGSGAATLAAALDFLGRNYPLHTPEWTAWSAHLHTPDLAGKWLFTAYEPGHGKYFGELTIRTLIVKDPTDPEFSMEERMQAMDGGPLMTRFGNTVVYAGFNWRGVSAGSNGARNAAPATWVVAPGKRCGFRPARLGPWAAGSGVSMRSLAWT